MTGQELIDLIEKYNLQDYELIAKFEDPSTDERGVSHRTFSFEKFVADFNYLDKTVVLSLVECPN